ncbi:MAG: thermonuclease family protein [Anaerolineales bacterium]|nr:thermonuclease family protein [Anaerolineales bacterium]
MKRNNPKLSLSWHNRGSMRLMLLLGLLAALALACDFSQFLPAISLPPASIGTEVPSVVAEPAETSLPTAEAIESSVTREAESSATYQQYLPLLSGGEATTIAKGLSLSPTPKPTRTPNGSGAVPTNTPTVLPTAYPTITPIPLSYLCIPPQTPQLGLVIKVVDGDTIRVLLDGKEEKVRYIGIDAPESTTSQEPFGREATKFNAQLVRDQIVELYRDVSETDRYGRLLRYVVANSVFVNLKVVEEGYATAVTYPPDVACAAIFQQAERTARLLGKGLWMLPTSTASP